MLPVINGEIPLKCHAHRADDILTAVRIAKEFGVKATLDHCTDGELISDELAKEGLPVFVGPTLGSKSKAELRHKSFTTPGALYHAGLTVSIITDAPVIPLEKLPMCAGLAANAGLPMEEACCGPSPSTPPAVLASTAVWAVWNPARTLIWCCGRQTP